MELKDKIGVVLIDDSMIDRMIVKRNMELYNNSLRYTAYEGAQEALLALKKGALSVDSEYTVVLLDIYMPEMSGFQFIDEVEKLESSITERLIVFMLSSSIDERDRQAVENRQSIVKLLNKPLTREILDEVFEYCRQRLSVAEE